MSADLNLPEIPASLRYLESHEWARQEPSGEITVGISAFAVGEIGDIVHIELPQPGQVLRQKETFGVIDSVKAAFDLYSPVSGEVTAVNSDLLADPAGIGAAPYENGWMIRIRPESEAELDLLLSAEAYKRHLAAGGGH